MIPYIPARAGPLDNTLCHRTGWATLTSRQELVWACGFFTGQQGQTWTIILSALKGSLSNSGLFPASLPSGLWGFDLSPPTALQPQEKGQLDLASNPTTVTPKQWVREQASRSPLRSSLPSAVKLDWASLFPPGLPIMIDVEGIANSTEADSGPNTSSSL